MKRIARFVCCILLGISATAFGQTPTQEAPTAAQTPAVATNPTESVAPCESAFTLKPERAEACKVQLELKKLDDAKTTSVLTILGLFVSALLGFGTIVFNLVMSNRQARLQAQLKALEVVMDASGPNSGRERLKVIKKLLGDELTADIDETMVIEGVGVGHDENRRTLLKLLADHPQARQEILADWAIVYPAPNKLNPNITALQAMNIPNVKPSTPPTAP